MTDECYPMNSESGHIPREKGSFRPGPQSGARTATILFLALLISLGTSLASIWGYDRYVAQKIVAVDLKGFLTEQRNEYLQGKITKKELDRHMDHMEAVVDRIPDRYAVILGDVVVRHVKVYKP